MNVSRRAAGIIPAVVFRPAPMVAAAFGALCALALAGPATAQQATGAGAKASGEVAGAVETVKGPASAAAGGATRPLEPRSSVFVGETVRTGEQARLLMRLGKRTTMRLGERTEIKIDRYIMDAGGEIELGQGAFQFERKGPKSPAPLNIRSAYGLIAVRGTRFFAGPSRGAFGVLVGEGKVEVTSGGKTVVVGPQQGTDIATPGAPPSDPKAWGYERVREALKSVR